MIFPTAQLCVYTKYDHTGKILGYAPWLQIGLNPDAAAEACFRQYGANLAKGEWDCVDIAVFGLPRFLFSLFTPVTTISDKRIRHLRRNKEAHDQA